MEYGDAVRLEVKSNLVLKEKERERFLSNADSVFSFVDAVRLKPGNAKRKDKVPLDRIVIPGNVLRKDKAIPSYKLEEICILPGDIEDVETFVIPSERNRIGGGK